MYSLNFRGPVKPQTSQPYSRIGNTILSNKPSISEIFIFLNRLILLYNKNTALLACSANLHWAWVKDPLEENITPRYDIASVVLISASPKIHPCATFGARRLKITTLDLVVFNLSFHFSQYKNSLCISVCNSWGLLANITTSSAYKSNNKRMCPMVIPAFGEAKYDSMSFIYIENKNGDRHSPWRTPNVE